MCGEKILSALVYYPPRQHVNTVIDGMISDLREICIGEQIVLLRDFNLDEMSQECINRLVSLKEIFN